MTEPGAGRGRERRIFIHLFGCLGSQSWPSGSVVSAHDLACGILAPQPVIQPMFPSLEGGCLTTRPARSPRNGPCPLQVQVCGPPPRGSSWDPLGTYGATDPTIAGFKAPLKEWKHPAIHPADHLSESPAPGVRIAVDSMVLTPAPRR